MQSVHKSSSVDTIVAPNTNRRIIQFLAGILAAALLLSACGSSADQVQSPGRLLYLQAQQQEDGGLYSDAIEKFEKLVTENRGTRLGGHGYLRLAELYSRQRDWVKAETNYRLFLGANANSHLNAYVLYRLLKVNEEKSYTGVFFPEREYDRDMEPNRQIVLEYKRFYLLHPTSIYLEEAIPIYRGAQEMLALHEVLVADFYFRRKLFNAAAGRYLFALRNYPEHLDTRYVLKQLIDSFRQDQQPDLATEMQRIYDSRFPEQHPVEATPPSAAR
jgi:outer membrane protein assembly factor BamD